MQSSRIRPFSRVGKPFSRWTGGRGASYVFSIYSLRDIPAYPHAVYVVARNRNKIATPILVAATAALPALLFHGDRYRRALKCGGNEVHVHVPAAGSCPEAIAADLSMVLSAEDAADAGSAAECPDFRPSFAH